MPIQTAQGVENNFTKGLITEATGLNFPENAVTDCDNCDFTVLSDVVRRLGIDLEADYQTVTYDRSHNAVNYYKWTNAGGDGSSQVFVLQVGSILRFYLYSSSSSTVPLSATILPTVIDFSLFKPLSSTLLSENFICEFSEGNGYLFVTNPAIEPIYISFIAGSPPTVSASQINVQVRDFTGIIEANVADNNRPSVNTSFHLYNLQNQGWLNSILWSAFDNTNRVITTGPMTFTVPAGMPVVVGNPAIAYGNIYYGGGSVFQAQTYVAGNVTAYVGTSLTINVTNYATGLGLTAREWSITPYSVSGQISTFQAAVGLFPSNADVWWYFKNAAGAFDPATTVANVTLATGPAPKGYYILDAFNQRRDLISGVLTAPTYSTFKRPRTNAWFAGRVWYAGTDDTKLAPGYSYPYTWTENIYFSQVAISSTQFGKCYQTNDPTSDTLFDILPTDGGVINIQGCGPIYKLFPIQNGMLVFAANGIWFITGSQGIGFSATDYTITKISSIRSISSSSFVDVNGLPYFWNEEGIYAVQPQQGGSLGVENLVVGSIQTFYDSIPQDSKRYVKGSFNPLEAVIQWTYRSTESSSDPAVYLTDAYTFDKILNYNTFTKAFFPYTVATTPASMQGVCFVPGIGGSNPAEAVFKYIVSEPSGGSYNFTFADARDEDYVDWASLDPQNYISTFTTGYKIRGQAMRKFQSQYVNVISRTNGEAFAYSLQGLWDYANSGDTGRWSSKQTVTRNNAKFDFMPYRHKIRGHGLALQFKISSVEGMPFDLIGWSTIDTVETGA